MSNEEANFARIWADRAHRVIVLEVPDAVRRDLMRFMPASDLPARLREPGKAPAQPFPEKPEPVAEEAEEPAKPPPAELRNHVRWFIQEAPTWPDGGERVGEATSAVTLWPHQVRAFERLYHPWPPRLLIADEVGLGKTIQAGMLLRQAWLSKRVGRVLILVPKAILRQWQVELREKFNLNWPIYDGRKLVWHPSPAWRGRNERRVDGHAWHRQPVVIASSQMMRRHDRAAVLLEEAAPWDLVVLDEAHHARRQAAGSPQQGGPNALLRLMRGLKDRAEGLVLLTATPMQVHPAEVWDLLELLGLPPEWTASAFLGFFEDVGQPSPSADAVERMARLFRSVERDYGEITREDAQGLVDLSRLKVNKVLRALRNDASIPRRQLETKERQAAVRIMRANTPLRKLISRHTRELLRRYFKAGLLTTPIADRVVEDRFLELAPEEREIYEAVEDYISSTYNQASAQERAAVGFVMTIYRRRLASSFRSLRQTLQNHLNAITGGERIPLTSLEEDAPEDEAVDEIPDVDQLKELTRKALAAEEEADVQRLLGRIGRLPPDSKLESLKGILHDLRQAGYGQVMVFTQYTDTMDFPRGELLEDSDSRLMCFSGRGGEVPSVDSSWRKIDRDEAKRRFRDGEADVLLCTDAAAEGLNFQFCGALVNYDMPWNPMRVEQRIGRIDRLGQRYEEIRIVNLHYEGTVETDVYRALRSRIGLFQSVVGRLQPILAQLPRRISETVLSGESRDARKRANVVDAIEQQTREAEAEGFDIDAVTESDLAMPTRAPSPVTMEDLDRVIRSPDLMPPGFEVRPLGRREYGVLKPEMKDRVRVTTDPAYYEEHSESLELWSPGNPLFTTPEFIIPTNEPQSGETLRGILDGGHPGRASPQE